LPLNEGTGSRSLAEVVDCAEKFRPVLQFLLGRTFYVGQTLFEEGILRGGADSEEESFQATPADLGRLAQELAALKRTVESSFTERARFEDTLSQREGKRAPLAEEEQRCRSRRMSRKNRSRACARIADESNRRETSGGAEREEVLAAIQQPTTALKAEEVLLTTLEEEEKTASGLVPKQDAGLQDLRHAVQTQLGHVSEPAVTG